MHRSGNDLIALIATAYAPGNLRRATAPRVGELRSESTGRSVCCQLGITCYGRGQSCHRQAEAAAVRFRQTSLERAMWWGSAASSCAPSMARI